MADAPHSLVIDTDGDRPTVTKSGRGRVAPRLRVEAAILAAARHPGVVSLVGPAVEDPDGTVRVRTRFAGSRTLATTSPLDPARAGALVAAVASTVADLHEIGVVHGRLTADHVILAADGRPVLCGLAGATHAGRGPHRAHDDVAALGELLRSLLATTPPEVEEPPRRRLHRRPPSLHLRGSLLNLADQATVDEPRRRPTARHLAQTLSTTVAGRPASPSPLGTGALARHPRGEVDDDDKDRPPSIRRTATALAAIGGLGLAVGLLGLLAGDDDTAGGEPTHDLAFEPPEAVTVEPGGFLPDLPDRPTTSGTTPAPEPPPPAWVQLAAGCTLPGVDGSDHATTADGRPCPSPMTLADATVTVDDVTFELSTDRPAIAIGDFGCAGRPVLAALDLDRGDVFVFRRWGGLGPTLANAIATVEAPRQLLAEPHGDGCHRLVVLDAWGLRHVVDVPAPEEDQP